MTITLSTLTGSDKQVSWATKIRNESLSPLLKLHALMSNQFDNNKNKLIDEIGSDEFNRQRQIITNVVQNFINEKTSASYWISNKTSHHTCEYFFNGAKVWYHNQVQTQIGNDELLKSLRIIHNIK